MPAWNSVVYRMVAYHYDDVNEQIAGFVALEPVDGPGMSLGASGIVIVATSAGRYRLDYVSVGDLGPDPRPWTSSRVTDQSVDVGSTRLDKGVASFYGGADSDDHRVHANYEDLASATKMVQILLADEGV